MSVGSKRWVMNISQQKRALQQRIAINRRSPNPLTRMEVDVDVLVELTRAYLIHLDSGAGKETVCQQAPDDDDMTDDEQAVTCTSCLRLALASVRDGGGL